VVRPGDVVDIGAVRALVEECHTDDFGLVHITRAKLLSVDITETIMTDDIARPYYNNTTNQTVMMTDSEFNQLKPGHNYRKIRLGEQVPPVHDMARMADDGGPDLSDAPVVQFTAPSGDDTSETDPEST
jgi:hypothetical protein